MDDLFKGLRAAGLNPILITEESFMLRITDVGSQVDKGGYIRLENGRLFVFARSPEAVFHLGGCLVRVTDTELILSNWAIARIESENRLVFDDDKLVFQAIQEFRGDVGNS